MKNKILAIFIAMCVTVFLIPAVAAKNPVPEEILGLSGELGQDEPEQDGKQEQQEPTDPDTPGDGDNPLIGISSAPISSPAKIVADNHNLMLRVDGRLFGWGDNTYGQLGFGAGAPTNVNEPTEIKFFVDNGLQIKDIYVVEDASYALCTNGELYVTGKGLNGRLGLGSTTSQNTWTLVPGSQSAR